MLLGWGLSYSSRTQAVEKGAGAVHPGPLFAPKVKMEAAMPQQHEELVSSGSPLPETPVQARRLPEVDLTPFSGWRPQDFVREILYLRGKVAMLEDDRWSAYLRERGLRELLTDVVREGHGRFPPDMRARIVHESLLMVNRLQDDEEQD